MRSAVAGSLAARFALQRSGRRAVAASCLGALPVWRLAPRNAAAAVGMEAMGMSPAARGAPRALSSAAGQGAEEPAPPTYTPPKMPSNVILENEAVLDPTKDVPEDQWLASYVIPEGDLFVPGLVFDDEKKIQDSEQVQLSREVWATPLRTDIIHRVVRYQLANRRQGTAATKGISQVSGSGKKPFAQKGSGRARQGSKREPQMRGGADPHPKRARKFSHKLNKKIRRFGLRSVLAARMVEGQVFVVKSFEVPEGAKPSEDAAIGQSKSSRPRWKTKDIVTLMRTKEWTKVAFIDKFEFTDSFRLAQNNIKGTFFFNSRKANVLDLLKVKTLVFSEEGLRELEERLDEKKQRQRRYIKRSLL